MTIDQWQTVSAYRKFNFPNINFLFARRITSPACGARLQPARVIVGEQKYVPKLTYNPIRVTVGFNARTVLMVTGPAVTRRTRRSFPGAIVVTFAGSTLHEGMARLSWLG